MPWPRGPAQLPGPFSWKVLPDSLLRNHLFHCVQTWRDCQDPSQHLESSL